MSTYNSQHNRAVWFDIPVADLDRAAKFYAAVLGVKVSKEIYGDIEFCVLDHHEGNGGCLIVKPEDITTTGMLLYLNTDGRIREATELVIQLGGKVLQPVRSIGPHGYDAIIIDSEGNRVALHSTVDA